MTLVLSSGAPILQLDDVIAEHRHAGALLTPTPRVSAPCVALAGFQRQAHANRARSNMRAPGDRQGVVPCDEGVANRIDPKSCAGFREGVCEAFQGSAQAKLLNRENDGRRRFGCCGRQYGRARQRKCRPARRGRRTWHVRTVFVREPGDLTVDQR